MKQFLLRVPIFLLLQFSLFSTSASTASCQKDTIPFSTFEDYFTIWNGQQYQPFVLKGVNLGVAVPGTQPSQMAASRQDYIRWITMIREAGFNNIRVYTLHFPDFYEVLDSINKAHPNHPLHIFQGVWLEESPPGYQHDLYQLTTLFEENITEVLDCIHGNRQIAPRPGKAYGNYTTDASAWVMGYIIGREVHAAEVIHTNNSHPSQTAHQGQAISLQEGTPAEAWIAARLDHLVSHERTTYQTERPVSFSSWPTLDPLTHPTNEEDIAHFDITRFDYSQAPAGLFATYHAYPYYPDFISQNPSYQTYFDYLGPNAYLGYLIDLKSHYAGMPLVIGEFGTSSSWGIAHFAQNGIYHGGMDELDQGLAYMRMMENVLAAGCAGGMMFSWIDEWFKSTWITTPIDFDPSRRILWHNITAAEQNFGLIKFQKPDPGFYALHENYCDTCLIHTLSVKADYTFFHVKLELQVPLEHQDTIWLALDTYDASLGESVLPQGHIASNRAEFAIRLTPYSAELYVTQAYDLFGNWHDVAGDEQLFRSIPTDGAPWKMVRWKTNAPELQVHYIGQLQVRHKELPESSHDGVIIDDHEIHIRLPWSLINFHDPSQHRVVHDDRQQPGTQDTLSDGILPMVFFRNFSVIPENRFAWEPWNHVLDVEEKEKLSLKVLRARLPFINNPPVATCRQYSLAQDLPLLVDEEQGLLSEAIDLDGSTLQVLLKDYPRHGSLTLDPEGSFEYQPDQGFIGKDAFSFQVFDGKDLSLEMTASLDVFATVSASEPLDQQVQIFPNPARGFLHINIPLGETSPRVRLSNLSGQVVSTWQLPDVRNRLDLSGIKPGVYLVHLQLDDQVIIRKLIIRH